MHLQGLQLIIIFIRDYISFSYDIQRNNELNVEGEKFTLLVSPNNHIPKKHFFSFLFLVFVVFVSTYKNNCFSSSWNNTCFIIGVKQILLFA